MMKYPMTPEDRELLLATRRQFFGRCGIGLGQIALASLLGEGKLVAESAKSVNPMAAKPPHFAPKVKNVIYLFMAGGPSQWVLSDYKPTISKYDGKVSPD